MFVEARARVIDEFNSQDDSSPTLMLLSLTAGGVGLNLTAATRVFLLDPVSHAAMNLFFIYVVIYVVARY